MVDTCSMLGKSRWLSILLAVALTTVGIGVSAIADSGSEQAFLSAINSTRSSAGLPPLKMDGGLQSHARKHSADMSAAGEIYHSSNSELQGAAGGGWEKLGENVGRGGTVSSLHQAFLDSASHRANIHGDYNLVGIGTDSADGVLYVTVVFMKKGGSTPTTTTTTAAPSGSSDDSKSDDSNSDDSKSDDSNSDDSKSDDSKSDDSNSDDSKSTDTSKTTPPADTTTTTIPPTTTTTLIVGPDKPVTPGESCYEATRYWWLCHD